MIQAHYLVSFVCVPVHVSLTSPIIIVIFLGVLHSLTPHPLLTVWHTLHHPWTSHFAFIRGERSELFDDDTLAILSPFIYRKGTITYFLWSEYNQIFTLWQFNIGHHSVYGSFTGEYVSVSAIFLRKEAHGTILVEKRTLISTLCSLSFTIFQSEVMYHLRFKGNEQKGHSSHRLGNWDYAITSFIVKCLEWWKIL